jgi:damage-control phosphatase, subfamily II, stand-alone protein
VVDNSYCRNCCRYNGILDQLLENPDAELPGFEPMPVCCSRLCRLRDTCLREAGFRDPYAAVKADEDSKALAMLGEILEELDSKEDPVQRFQAALHGVFAGNVFDLGAPKMVEQYERGVGAGQMFKDARMTLAPRPWAVDKLDEVLERFGEGNTAHKKAIVFCDNAGADVVLGMVPFMRELLLRGTEVVVAANSVPSINDVTVPEMEDIMERAGRIDGVLGQMRTAGKWRLVSSGNDMPVIDLRRVSVAVAKEAEDADLVVLEGMGRGIETNLYAKFTVDSLKLAMIKHEEVATCLGGKLYDCVCQFFGPCPGTKSRVTAPEMATAAS